MRRCVFDATIVRGVLLPATMKPLGDWNWYLPKHLGWLPKLEPEDTRASTRTQPVNTSSEVRPANNGGPHVERGNPGAFRRSGPNAGRPPPMPSEKGSPQCARPRQREEQEGRRIVTPG